MKSLRRSLGSPIIAVCLVASITIGTVGSLSTASAQLRKNAPTKSSARVQSISLDDLTDGKVVSGFRTEAVYTDESDKPLGARFLHQSTGFTLDVLRIQSSGLHL